MNAAPAQGTQTAINPTMGGKTAPDAVATGENGGMEAAGSVNKADAREVVAKLQQAVPMLQNSESVATVDGTEFAKGSVDLITQVSDFFKSIGNKVHRAGFGDVILGRREAKNDIAHGIGRAKAATFKAVPDVIVKGKQIDYVPNWKERGQDSYIFAAPVNYANSRTYVAAIVMKDTDNRFYLHEVVDENGNIIFKTKDTTAAIKTGVTVQDGITGDHRVSNELIIPSPAPKVNVSPDIVSKNQPIIKNGMAYDPVTLLPRPAKGAESVEIAGFAKSAAAYMCKIRSLCYYISDEAIKEQR